MNKTVRTKVKAEIIKPYSKICDQDIESLSSFLQSKFDANNINIYIQEVVEHEKLTKMFTPQLISALKPLQLNILDYLSRYSVANFCTQRGDNRVRDERGKVYYVMSSKVESVDNNIFLSIEVISSHTLVRRIDAELTSILQSAKNLPTHMIRTIRQSLVYAKQEDRGELDSDRITMIDDY